MIAQRRGLWGQHLATTAARGTLAPVLTSCLLPLAAKLSVGRSTRSGRLVPQDFERLAAAGTRILVPPCPPRWWSGAPGGCRAAWSFVM